MNSAAASLWNRFWSPRGMLEPMPPGASEAEAAEIDYRNAIWLRSYMDMYILRWACLWLACLALAILAHSYELPAALLVAALLLTIYGFIGMVVMIGTYRRAARMVRDRIAAGRRPP
ncbi:hypothetical protein [Variovorax sp. KK3]|uniref:hypothetical protein n=1 Tax=Variovorax sp. KK3 TaxID=1855728 RepID=UPI00097C17B9|nr:hypothetical protein [Variovorax sp. KK3]